MLPQVQLGRLLVESGMVTTQQLDELLAVQREQGDGRRKKLGELLVERGLVRPQELAQLLSHQLSCPWISLDKITLSPAILALVPREVAVAHAIVPVHTRVIGKDTILYVATDDPTDEVALASCSRAAQMPVRPMVAIVSDIRQALRAHYGVEPTIPPPRASSVAPAPEEIAIDDDEVIEVAQISRPIDQPPLVVAIAAPAKFLDQCRAASTPLGAIVVVTTLVEAADEVTKQRPCAIVVTEEVYAFDRSRISHLALDNDAVLVVWSEDADEKQLELLLKGAIKRWRRASYAKDHTVDGRYELLRDLGGRVGGSRWEARHTRTNRRCVVKIGVKTQDIDETLPVQGEQQALARVIHPCVVELRDAGTTELGDPYIVLEPLEGRTLAGLVAARGKLPMTDGAALMLGIAEALAAAHGAGVFHTDLQPEHIVIIRDVRGHERAKLTGWKCARLVDDAGSSTGKDDAARADAVRADLHAIGACIFYALAGHMPREGEDVSLPEAPAALADAVARTLSTESDAQFGTAKEVADALAAAIPWARDGSALLQASRQERGRDLPPAPAEAAPTATAQRRAFQLLEQAKTGPEQRKAIRAPYRTPVRIAVPGIGAVDGRSEDISTGGLFVVTRARLTAGTDVTVRFALPLDGKVIAESARVRWSRATREDDASALWGLGLELAEPTAETIRQVEKYVAFMGTEEEHAS